MYFIGWSIASLIVPPFADIYGRKYVFIVSIIIYLYCYASVLLSSNFYTVIGLFFIIGSLNVGKSQICYLYLQELVPKRYRTVVGSSVNAWDAFLLVWMSIYFALISKNWVWF